MAADVCPSQLELVYLCLPKGTVSQYFSSLFFIIKQLLLVPLDISRKDLEFCRIFVEIFIFVIGSPVSPPWSHDFPVVFITGKSRLPRDEYTDEFRPKMFLKNTCWSRLPCNEYTVQSWFPAVLVTSIFFVNQLWCWYQTDQEVETPPGIHHRGVETFPIITTVESRLPYSKAYSSLGSCSDTREPFFVVIRACHNPYSDNPSKKLTGITLSTLWL